VSTPNLKRARMASEIAKAAQDVLARGLSDPRIRGLITVTEVDLTEDRKRAIIRVSVMPREHEKLTLHGLRAATSHVRRETMRRVRTREFPAIAFEIDEAYKQGQDVLSLIARSEAEQAPEDPIPPDPDAAEDRAND